jgi:TonB-linked SusC/RagA family outer membrane protein
MASHEAQEWTWKNIAASRSNFPANILDLNVGATTDASGVNSMTNSGGSGAGTMESYLGRINYNYAERYMLLGTIRTDGSSNFGINNRWGTFPSVSAAWRISKEPWYNIKFLNEAKLRFETGTTGNSGSGGVYATMTAGPTPFGGSGFLLNQYANPDLKWESTVSYNGGLNLGFFKNRIQLEADYYVRNTSNLLMQAPVPNYMGVSGTGAIRAPQINFGSIQNKGWAFTLNTTNIDTKEFTWTSNFNISGVRPVVTQLNTNSAQASRTVNGLNNVMQVCQIGKAPWLFYGYIQEGYFTSVADVENSARPVDNTGTPYPADVDASKGIWVGDIKYKDISGPDGKPDGKITTQDQTVIGNPWPKFFGGFTNTFSYKGLDLNILLTYSSGNSILNYQAFMATGPNNFWVGRNYLAGVTDYAQIGTDGDGNPYLVNPNAFVPRITTTGDKDVNGNYNRITTRWIEDGSYIRVKNISLSYSLPKTLLYKTKFITGLRLTFSAQNVLTFTKYTGFDPEVGTYVGSSVYGSGNQLIGVDYNHYPLSPIYTFSVNVNL